MVKKLTKVGNSQAVIIPAHMIVKFRLGKKIRLEETPEGILIRNYNAKDTPFQKEMRFLRANKEQIYKEIREQANHPDTQAYYANPENRFDDAEPDIKEDY